MELRSKLISAGMALPVVCCLLITISTKPCSAEKLTIRKCVETALESSPMMAIAGENVRKADALVEEAFVPARPNLRIDTNYQRLDQAPVVDFGGSSIPVGSLFSRTADITFQQEFDVFGIIKVGKKAAKYGKKGYEHIYSQQVNDTTLETKTAYYNVLRSQEYLDVQRDMIAQMEAHVKDAETNYKAGTIPKFEVLRAETQLANGRQGLIAAENGVELAKSAFNNTLGRSLETRVELAEPEKLKIIELALVSCVDSACNYRPEVLRADAQVKYAEAIEKATRLRSKPRFVLKWDYNQNLDTNAFNTRSNSWKAYLNSTLSLYDGGATRAAVKKAEIDTRNARSMKEQAMRAAMLDAQQSYLSLNEAKERISACEKALDEANESMRLANLRYKGGISTQVEVLDAQTALSLARMNHVTALYDYQVAQARLEHSVGGEVQMARLLEHSNSQIAEKVTK